MIFTPTEAEKVRVNQILDHIDSEYRLIRITETMYEKSIIDASKSISRLLFEHDYCDYSSIAQGPENKIIKAAIILNHSKIKTRCSMYRPHTKNGDNRFWIYGLKKHVQINQLVMITFVEMELYIIPIDPEYDPSAVLRRHIRDRGIDRHLLEILTILINEGPVISVSPNSLHNKDVGETLERELGILPNNSVIADYRGLIEIKAKLSNSRTKDTLFAKVPDWNQSVIKSSADMMIEYGYASTKHDGYIDLYVTVSNNPNPQGLYLLPDDDDEKLYQMFHEKRTCVWDYETLRNSLFGKHPETLWIVADKLVINNQIYFDYKSIEHTKKPQFQSFITGITTGDITYDWRGKVLPDKTAYRDHGHAFRCKPSYRSILFKHSSILF